MLAAPWKRAGVIMAVMDDVTWTSIRLVMWCLIGGCPVYSAQDLSNWMGKVDDSTSLHELSIPGTHASLAFYGGSIAQCQTKPLKEQYDMGVRFVDIRCRRNKNSLPIHHGKVFQKQYFAKDAVKPTVEWLNKHPTETILMLIKQEYEPIIGTRSFSSMIRGSLESEGAKCRTTMPENIGEARGHIIIFHKDWPRGDLTYGIPLFNNPYVNLYDGSKEYSKHAQWEKVEQNLDNVRGTGKSNVLFVTYASGNPSPNPNAGEVADFLNTKLNDYCRQHNNDRLGVVLIDFLDNEGNVAEALAEESVDKQSFEYKYAVTVLVILPFAFLVWVIYKCYRCCKD